MDFDRVVPPRMPDDDLRRRTADSLLWSTTARWGGRIMSTALFVLLARLLSPTDFGLITMALVYMQFADVLITEGVTTALVQRDEIDSRHISSALAVSVVVGVTLSVLTAVTAPLLAGLFAEDTLADILRWLSVALLVNSINSVPVALLTRRLDFKVLARRQLAAGLVGAIVAVTLAVRGFGPYAIVGQYLSQLAISTLVLWHAVVPLRVVAPSWTPVRELLTFGVNVTGIGLLRVLDERADDLLIGIVLGPAALGAYGVAYRLLLAIHDLVAVGVGTVGFSSLSRVQTDPDRLRSGMRKILRLTVVVSVPIFAGFASLAPQVVPMVFGGGWSESIPVMRVLALYGVVQAIAYVLGEGVKAAGHPGRLFAVNTVNTVVNVALFAVAVHRGIVAVAVVLVARSILLSPLLLSVVRRTLRMGIGSIIRVVLPPALAGATMAAAVVAATSTMTGRSSVTLVAVGATVGAITYAVVLFAFERSLMDDVRELRSLIGSRSRVPV